MTTLPSPPSVIAFLAIVAWVAAGAIGAQVATADRSDRLRSAGKALLAVSLWMALTALPTAAGWLRADAAMPGAPVFLGALLVSVTALALSPLGARWARLPLWALVGFQAFRLPLELVLHAWAGSGVVPPQMTWTGANPDILSGIIALSMAPLVTRSRAAAWVAQGMGVVLLFNVIRVVVQSFDTPLRLYEHPVLLVFSVPTVWIASMCIAGAWAAHIIAFRALWAKRQAQPTEVSSSNGMKMIA